MDLRHLRAFQVVARTLNVTRAAEELHYAQSSITEQIQALERELATPLFDRSSRKLRLTPAGQSFADYTDRILALLAEARFAVTSQDSEPVGDLPIGALETLCAYRLPTVLSRYRARYPRVRITLSQGNRGQLYQAVRRGEMDLCLTFRAPDDPALRSEVLAEIPLVVVTPPGHRIAGRAEIDLGDLRDEPFLATQHGCGFREMYDSAFGSLGHGHLQAEVSSVAALVACVASGMGCALLPAVAVAEGVQRGQVAALPVADQDFHTQVMMTWLGCGQAKPSLHAFQDMLRTEMAAAAV